MKRTILAIAVATLGSLATLAAAERTPPGPKGGRMLETTPFRAEFLVTDERRVEIILYDDHQNPVLPGPQVIAVTAEPGGRRVPVEMTRTDTEFVSKDPLPAGEPYRLVVQFRPEPDARPQNFRIDLNLETCGECRRKEYACSCEGH